MAEFRETSGQQAAEGAARDSERHLRLVTNNSVPVAIAH
jgi:hypothetical protein